MSTGLTRQTLGQLARGGVLGAATIATAVAVAANLKNESNLNAFGSSLYHPSDLGSEKYPYYMSFSFREYQRRSIFDRQFLKDVGMIRLPPPNQLIDAQRVTYDQTGSDIITGAVFENALRGSTSAADAARRFTAAGAAGALAAGAAGARFGAGGVLGAGAVGLTAIGAVAATGDVNQVQQFLQIGGVAQNPFLTMLFKSPTFKQHQFSWTFNPENEQETEIVNNIINKFKYHQLPDISNYSAGTLLSYPDIVLVGLYPSDKYLYKFKPCVIESIAINYAADGQPSYFTATDAPTTIQLQISLIEIELWIRGDIIAAQAE